MCHITAHLHRDIMTPLSCGQKRAGDFRHVTASCSSSFKPRQWTTGGGAVATCKAPPATSFVQLFEIANVCSIIQSA